MNGQDPNQNPNNINPEGQTPVTPAVPVAPEVNPTMPEAVPVTPTPAAIDPASVMPAAPVATEMTAPSPALETPAGAPTPVGPVMPDTSAVMPEAPATPAAPGGPDVTSVTSTTTVNPAPVAIDPASVMPAAPAVPATPVAPEAQTVMPQTSVTPGTSTSGQASAIDSNLAGQVPPVAPNASGEEKTVKKGIAIDKNIIIIVVGLIIIVVVLLFAWKNGILFTGKKPAPVANPNPAVNNAVNNTTPTTPPANEIKNAKDAKQKVEAMPWFDELIKTKYSELESGKDILEDTDNMLFIAYEISKNSSSAKIEDITSSTCNIDAKAMQISEINNILSTVFDEELANKNLTSSKIYAAEEYTKLKSSSTCQAAKTCGDTGNCMVTDSYALFDNKTNEYENTLKYEDLSYDEDTQELTGKLVMTYTSNTKEATFLVKFDNELIKSIEIEK